MRLKGTGPPLGLFGTLVFRNLHGRFLIGEPQLIGLLRNTVRQVRRTRFFRSDG